MAKNMNRHDQSKKRLPIALRLALQDQLLQVSPDSQGSKTTYTSVLKS